LRHDSEVCARQNVSGEITQYHCCGNATVSYHLCWATSKCVAMDILQWFLFSIVALQNILNCLCLCYPSILIPFHSKRLVLWRFLCQSQQHYTLRSSCTLRFCPVLTIFGIFFTDYNRCLLRQIWKSAEWDGRTDITMVKDAFRVYPNVPEVNETNSF